MSRILLGLLGLCALCVVILAGAFLLVQCVGLSWAFWPHADIDLRVRAILGLGAIVGAIVMFGALRERRRMAEELSGEIRFYLWRRSIRALARSL